MEVESNPLVLNVLNGFRSIVEHDKGGVFYPSLTLERCMAEGANALDVEAERVLAGKEMAGVGVSTN